MVLTAGNLNDHYLQIFPLIHKVWKKRFNLECYCVLISKTIPDYLKDYKENIILFDPIEGLNNIYVAQVIRLLYPVLFPDKTILITDLDIIPVKKEYFIKPLEFVHDNTFVTYTERYKKQEMYAICYNVAKGKTFQKMFGISTKEEIIKKLKDWYNDDYTGKKNCPGWFTDQKKLYEHFEKYNDYKSVLQDKKIGYKRLHNRARDKEIIVKNLDKILDNIEEYSDIHCIKPFNRTKGILKKIVRKLV